MGEVDRLFREPIEVRRFHVRVAGITQRVGAPLVGEDEEDVGSVCRFRGVGRTRGGHQDDRGRERQRLLQ